MGKRKGGSKPLNDDHRDDDDGKKGDVAKLPKNKSEYSANWKELLRKMESERTNTKQNQNQSAKRQKKVVKAEPVKPKRPEIWFDDVDESLLVDGYEEKCVSTSALVKEKSFKGLTKAIGMDCEMVGVGFKGEESIVARVSIVNHFGHCVYDKYVKPSEKVSDYRTKVSGIRPGNLKGGWSFKEVQKEVADILNGRILVGHSIKHDLKVLFLTHPRRAIRDTSLYKPFRAAFNGKTPSLKNLALRMLGVSVQEGEHSSIQDAQAAMRLYTMFKKDWEKELVHTSTRRALPMPNPSNSHHELQKAPRPECTMTERPGYVDSD